LRVYNFQKRWSTKFTAEMPSCGINFLLID
jgi:hypothetical protein